MTAAATTGPNSDPRPTSSTPATSVAPDAHASFSYFTVQRRLFNSRSFAAAGESFFSAITRIVTGNTLAPYWSTQACECKRKSGAREISGGSRNLQEHASDVVMLRSSAYELVHLRNGALQEHVWAGCADIRQYTQQSVFAIRFGKLVLCFDKAIGDDRQPKARSQCHLAAIVGRVYLNAQRHSAEVEPLDVAGHPTQNRSVVSSVDVLKNARGGIEFCEERSCKTQSSLAVTKCIAVHARHQVGQRAGCRGERLETGLECSHQQRCGNALAGNVCHCQHEAVFSGNRCRTGKCVIVIAGHGIRRTSRECNCDSRHQRWSRRQ